ncbi:MAG: 3-phosphoshikimate 1-carboxyvinyltransferase [Acidimicrobiales bacterium]
MSEEMPAEQESPGGLPPTLALNRSGPLSGTVAAPGSKSHTNRALVIAALAEGESRLIGPLVAHDTDAMVTGLRAMGVRIALDGDDYVVTGTGGELGVAGGPDVVIHAGDSGTTLRFLTAVATLGRSVVTITGSDALMARPIGPLVSALRELGCDVEATDGRGPVTVRPGRPRAARIEVDAATSSQYVSALALVSPYATVGSSGRPDSGGPASGGPASGGPASGGPASGGPASGGPASGGPASGGPDSGGAVELVPTGLGASGYVDLTTGLMRRWGVGVDTAAGVITVSAGQRYRARTERIAGDASSAAHLFALAVATGGEVSVTNLGLARSQPDMGILGVLSAMGVSWHWEGDDTVVVTGPESLQPVEVDLAPMPDLLPVVAALASLAFGVSRLSGLGVARHHETDRVAAVAAELARLGIATETTDDSLVVKGGGPQGMVTICTYGDHRMAMAFAALGARLPFIVIQDPACVAKTFPGFWAVTQSLGLSWRSRLNFTGLKF